MEYIYAALLLHSAEKEVTEEAITAIVAAAGIEVDTVRAKALVSALEGVDIKEAIEKAAITAAPAAAPVAAAAPAVSEEAPAAEDKAAEEEKAEESGMEGLGALFG
ncbi:MAG: 50S ribosomal protein P1 [Candidatus Methanoperedens sp.]|nr:50S ribosomal protein P1 [Candidatus Methanoperedens sp.]